MRDPNRLDKFYDELKVLHKDKYPDRRFLQIMLDFIGWIMKTKKIDPFFIEEERCLKLFMEYTEDDNPFFNGDVLYDTK